MSILSSNSNNDKLLNEQEKVHLIKVSSYYSVITVFLIIALKIFGWLKTDSVAILASLGDSLLDAVTSLINLITVYYATKPPDNEHRFGHQKAEDLAVFAQASLFIISGIILLVLCIKRLYQPELIQYSQVGIVVMSITLILTLLLIIFQKYILKKTNSKIVHADHLHYSVDLLSNLAVIISLLISNIFNSNLVDPIFGLIIAIYLLKSASSLIIQSFQNLMDHEFKVEEKNQLISLIKTQAQVINIHDLKTRKAGNKSFIQFHLVLSHTMNLEQAYQITKKIEEKIINLVPEAEIIIRLDPDNIDELISYHE